MRQLLNKTMFKNTALIVLTAAIFIFAAQSGFCEPDMAAQVPDLAQSAPMSKSDAIVKFAIAMIGVMLSSVVIFAGLWVYNKFFVDKSLFPNNDKDDVLNTPKSVDEAVVLFIKRNKLC